MLLFALNHYIGQVLRRYILAFHLQQLLGCSGFGNNECQHKIDKDTHTIAEGKQYHQESPDNRVGIGIYSNTRQYACQHLILGVAIQFFASCTCTYILINLLTSRTGLLFPVGAVAFLLLLAILASKLFGLADTGDDFLNMLDGDGLDALQAQFVEEFGDAGLDVVHNLVAALLFSKR